MLAEDAELGGEQSGHIIFRDLATTLQFRFVRAFEHWRGNTHLTLTAIIVRTVEENARARGGHQR